MNAGPSKPSPVLDLGGNPVFVAAGHRVVILMRDGGGMSFDLDGTRELIEKLGRALELAGGDRG